MMLIRFLPWTRNEPDISVHFIDLEEETMLPPHALNLPAARLIVENQLDPLPLLLAHLDDGDQLFVHLLRIKVAVPLLLENGLELSREPLHAGTQRMPLLRLLERDPESPGSRILLQRHRPGIA